MINPLIKKQLDKLQLATSSDYDAVKHQFVFKKIAGCSLEVGKCYLVNLDKSLTNESVNDSLVYNLNKGTFPKYTKMRIDVIKISKGLVLVNGTCLDNDDIKEFWSGWLPVKQIEVLDEI